MGRLIDAFDVPAAEAVLRVSLGELSGEDRTRGEVAGLLRWWLDHGQVERWEVAEALEVAQEGLRCSDTFARAVVTLAAALR